MKEKTNQKISIVTCFLNVGNFLDEAIKSVLKQDYPNWEMWLIDDGSTDGSTEIAQRYADEFSGKIFYYEHPDHGNMGASFSRNIGINLATGEYIAFLDGDDVWLPGLLSGLVNLMHLHNPALVCEATEYWYNWDGSALVNEVVPLGARQDHLHRPPQLMLDLYPLGKGQAPCICGMLVKKEIVQRYGGFEASFKGMYDDQALLIKIYLHEKVYISSTCHNLYRQRKGSLVESSHSSGNYHQERHNFLEWLDKYLYENRVSQPMVKKQLRRALYPYRYPFLYSFFHNLPGRGWKKMKRIIKMLRKG